MSYVRWHIVDNIRLNLIMFGFFCIPKLPYLSFNVNDFETVLDFAERFIYIGTTRKGYDHVRLKNRRVSYNRPIRTRVSRSEFSFNFFLFGERRSNYFTG